METETTREESYRETRNHGCGAQEGSGGRFPGRWTDSEGDDEPRLACTSVDSSVPVLQTQRGIPQYAYIVLL
ncbi:hypothetical protein FIBSPDRAFT_875406 [Athelia psychrophila]|uniref:Uncharacterized protein n=1 Tax=Athelia psychrophila TaxID=1759441 RepID=A0A167XSE0_9AGAM|nr:hypothetical protein FIBSPDRAFT_875406 [Fibularhizoctonia sp. CBS 109695]